jgi:hypothetical protein
MPTPAPQQANQFADAEQNQHHPIFSEQSRINSILSQLKCLFKQPVIPNPTTSGNDSSWAYLICYFSLLLFMCPSIVFQTMCWDVDGPDTQIY